MSINIDKSTLIEALKKITKELGATPSRDEFIKKSGIPRAQIDKHFLKYSNLVEEAGVDRVKRTKEALAKKADALANSPILHPVFPDDDIPVEEIINSMVRRFGKRKEAHDSKKWMEFKINSDQPIGIMWFGDPHIDDDGCNWPLLMDHIRICKETEGMFGANIGDTHNNWVGRLVKEYANQNTSRGTAWKLIDWFFRDSGVNWLLILLGNHDAWNFGSETMGKITQNICTMIDWRAQIKLKFSNNSEVFIDAAHDHAGHSQWNSLHGQQKASSMGGIAHLYIAGHKHNWALAQNECPHTHRIYWLARARGYKHIDHYGENLGYGSQKFGSSVVSVIDPKANDVNRVRCFADPQEGADYLTFLRKK